MRGRQNRGGVLVAQQTNYKLGDGEMQLRSKQKPAMSIKTLGLIG